MGFDNNIFAGLENESPFIINQFVNRLLFIRIVKVLELTTSLIMVTFTTTHSARMARPRSIQLGIIVASTTSIILNVLPLAYISVQGVGSLMSYMGYLSLLGVDSELIGVKG
jgi:hypothetical protein